MKTALIMMFVAMLLSFAAACSDEDNNGNNDEENTGTAEAALDQEAVFAQTLEMAEEIDHYEVDLKMVIQVDNQTGLSDSFSGSMTGQVNESTENGYLEIVEEDGGEQNYMSVYLDDDERYENLNDQGWTVGDTADNEWHTSYSNVAAVLDGLEEAETEEQEDYYEVVYSGNSIDVYNAFEYPYSLSLTGFDVENDAHMEVSILIDKDQFTIRKLSFVIDAENEVNTARMEITSDYANLNNVDAIEIPDEVRQEASASGDGGETGTVSGHHDVLVQTLEMAENIDHYEIDLEIFITLEAAAGFTDESYARLAGQINESTVNGYLETTEEQAGHLTEMAVYMDGDEQYENLNGQGWIQSNPEFNTWETSYGNVAAVLDGLAEADVTETEYHYEVTYSGNSLAVYEAFEYPFSLSLTGFDVEMDTIMHVSVLIDKDQFTISDMSFLLEADNAEGNLEMEITVDYENVNNIEPIDIPDEVKTEAD